MSRLEKKSLTTGTFNHEVDLLVFTSVQCRLVCSTVEELRTQVVGVVLTALRGTLTEQSRSGRHRYALVDELHVQLEAFHLH